MRMRGKKINEILVSLGMIRKLLFFFSIGALVCMLNACFSESGEEQFLNGKSDKNDLKPTEIPVKQISTAKSEFGNLIKSNIVAENNCVKIKLDFSAAAEKLIKINCLGKDTFRTTIFYFQILCNEMPLDPFVTEDLVDKYKLDSLFVLTTSQKNLLYDREFYFVLPFYYLKDVKANSRAEIKIRIWQDYFLSDEKERKIKSGNYERTEYYRDTLRKKQIDNVYAFSIKIPEIYRTDIVCDSVFLQDDKEWSPIGSDNTIWNSSFPDIYFNISDEFWLTQNKSHIEKSCSYFNIPDTLVFYHYTKDDAFRLQVLDHDMLSRDDLLGAWKGQLSQLTNRKRYVLKFGHVDKFYIYKIEMGLQN